jgi:hypothetical protein
MTAYHQSKEKTYSDKVVMIMILDIIPLFDWFSKSSISVCYFERLIQALKNDDNDMLIAAKLPETKPATTDSTCDFCENMAIYKTLLSSYVCHFENPSESRYCADCFIQCLNESGTIYILCKR